MNVVTRLSIATLVLAACVAPNGTGGEIPTASGLSASTPMIASGVVRSPPATLPDCDIDLTERPSGPLAVVLADGERQGTAVVVRLGASDRVVARIRLGYQPVVHVDARNRQLLAICSPVGAATPAALVSYSLDDLTLRWRVPIDERVMTKVLAWQSIHATVDGRHVLTYHSRTLRPGDGNAPGATRYWISIREQLTGAVVREVEIPDCGVGTFHQATMDELYVACREGIRVIQTATWQVVRSFPTAAARVASLTGRGDRYVLVTHGLWLSTYDTSTGHEISSSKWTDAVMPTVPFFDRLAMTQDASKLWVPVAPPSYEARPGHAIAEIDLATGKKTQHPVSQLGAVAFVDGRVMFVDGGRFGSLGRRPLVDLGVSHRAVGWRIMAGP